MSEKKVFTSEREVDENTYSLYCVLMALRQGCIYPSEVETSLRDFTDFLDNFLGLELGDPQAEIVDQVLSCRTVFMV